MIGQRKILLQGAGLLVRLALLAAAMASEPAVAQRYTVTALGTTRPNLDESTSVATAINNHGQIVGTSDGDAVLWENGGLINIGRMTGAPRGTSATDINDSGYIVGGLPENASSGGFLWSDWRTMNLSTLLPSSSSVYAINASGQMVGTLYLGGFYSNWGAFRTAAYRPTRAVQDELPSLPGQPSGYKHDFAYAINTQGQVVGESGSVGCLWQNDSVQRLNGLGSARGINDVGQIVGTGIGQDPSLYLWQNGQSRSLGNLPGYTITMPRAINNRGEVVGYVGNRTRYREPERAFIYTGGVLKNLNDLLPPKSNWTLIDAYDINDRGEIVGWGNYHGSPRGPIRQAFLLTPVGLTPPPPPRARRLPPGRVAVYRPRTGEWILRADDGSPATIQFGGPDDQPVPADYLGTSRAQIAVFRPNTQEWFIRGGRGETITIQFGGPGDVPVAADFLGTGRAQIAVFRPSTREWFIRDEKGGATVIQFGGPGDQPAPGDYLGLSRAQIAVYRPSTLDWFIRTDKGGTLTIPTSIYGIYGSKHNEMPVPGDYFGLGRAQMALYSTNYDPEFLVRTDRGDTNSFRLGWKDARPVPGDYLGLGRLQFAVFGPDSGDWFIRSYDENVTTYIQWGGTGDIPVSAAFAPRFGLP